MSIRKVHHVLEHINYRPAEKMVLVVMADVATHQGYTWPGIDYIAEKASISRRTAISILKTMEERGDIFVKKTRGRGNQYIIMVETTFEDFLEAATGDMGIEEEESIEAYWKTKSLAESSAEIAQSGAEVAPSSAEVALGPVQELHGAGIAPLKPTSGNQSGNSTGAKIAPVQPVAPDPVRKDIYISIDQWSAILDGLKMSLSKDVYQAAFAAASILAVKDHEVVVKVESKSSADWINQKLQPQILLAVKSVVGEEVKVWARV